MTTIDAIGIILCLFVLAVLLVADTLARRRVRELEVENEALRRVRDRLADETRALAFAVVESTKERPKA
jgi:hypothetical protein